MDPNTQVDVASLLQSVAGMLEQNKAGLNSTSAAAGGGTHGDRVAQAFRAGAQAAQQSRSNDAGVQFEAAAQALREQGQGKAIQYYANGLEQAGQQFQGKQGLDASDLMPLLQSLAGGAQQNNPMQPGQGSMLDALLPAVQSYMNAKNRGMSMQDAAMQALGGAVSGAQGTTRAGSGNGTGTIDPGAASATNVIGGIVGALLPGVIGALTSGGLGGQSGRSQTQSPGRPQSGSGSVDGPVSGSGNPLDGLGGNPDDPLGGLGGLLGGLLGGSAAGAGGSDAPGEQEGQSPLGSIGGLLGGLFDSGGEPEAPRSGSRQP